MIVRFVEINDIIDNEKGYTEDIVRSYYTEIILVIEKTKKILRKSNAGIKVYYDTNVINQIVVDAVEDLKRIKDFQPIENANAIKEAAYFGFWLNKRKPIHIEGDIYSIEGINDEQTNRQKINCMFINELCTTIYMMPKIFSLSVQADNIKKEQKAVILGNWKKYFDYLIYFFAYRAESPNNIEALLTSLIMQPMWKCKSDFWAVKDV